MASNATTSNQDISNVDEQWFDVPLTLEQAASDWDTAMTMLEVEKALKKGENSVKHEPSFEEKLTQLPRLTIPPPRYETSVTLVHLEPKGDENEWCCDPVIALKHLFG